MVIFFISYIMPISLESYKGLILGQRRTWTTNMVQKHTLTTKQYFSSTQNTLVQKRH